MARIPLLTLTVALVGCGDRLFLDEEAVDVRLDRIDATVPLCTSPDATAMRRVAAELPALVRGTRWLRDHPGPAPLPVAGSCGGTLDVTSEHADGVTDYVLALSGYCLNSPEGPVTLDGTVVAREVGRPSEAGPVVSAFELSTDGPLALEHGGETLELVVDDARTEYGLPAAWAPETPDEDHPDVFTVKEATVTFSADGRTDYVRDVRIERTGGAVALVTITDGRLGTVGEGYVDVRTADGSPVEVDFGAIAVTGGVVELHGGRGSVLAIEPDPSATGAFLLTLDGVALDRDVDCTAARQPLVEAGLALLTELPIH